VDIKAVDYGPAKTRPLLSIIIPVFNESLRIPRSASLLNEALTIGYIDRATTEIIVIDDGSTDDSHSVVKKRVSQLVPNFQLIRLPSNQGKGAAIREGVKNASGEFTIFLDLDVPVDLAQIPELLRVLRTSPIAIGSRSLPESFSQIDRRHRVLMGKTYSFLVNALLPLKIKDTQCGFKGFQTPISQLLFYFLEIKRYGFDIQILSHARRLDLKIEEVPVNWSDIAGSKINPIRDSAAMIRDLLKMCLIRHQRPKTGILIKSSVLDDAELDKRLREELEKAQVECNYFHLGRGFRLVIPSLGGDRRFNTSIDKLDFEDSGLVLMSRNVTLGMIAKIQSESEE